MDALIKRVEKFGSFGQRVEYFDLNNHAWTIFLRTNNNAHLQKALMFSKKSIELNSKYANAYDTYANILYKMGKRDEAIVWQQKAVDIDTQSSKGLSMEPDKVFAENLEKMRRHEPLTFEN